MNYDQWYAKVSRIVERHLGLDLDDLADVDYMGMYEDEYTPSEAAREVISQQF